jgi:NADH-quinone oxidoreductase subunit N
VPFHTWVPDVYQGSPTPVTGFMASVAKAAGFAALLRVFVVAFESYELDWKPMVWALAVLTMIVGSVLAVVQTDVKRMLAYSSISHAGFILVGVQAASNDGTSSALFYLAAYTFMIAGSFGVVTIVGGRGDARHSLTDYRGLARRRPLLAFAFTVFLLAQAGVPLTTGFFAKFSVIAAAAGARHYELAVVAMVSAVIAAFLYLRIVVNMYVGEEHAAAADPARPEQHLPPGAVVALTVALAATVVFGILPGVVVNLARDAVPTLVAAGG